MVALLLVACSGTVWGDNLTVTIARSDGVQNTKTGRASLAMAFKGLPLEEVVGIEVSAGNFAETDWYWLRSKKGESGSEEVCGDRWRR